MKKKNVYLRTLGIVFALIIIFSSVRVVFANQDIAYMLEIWINNKRVDSIQEIERTIKIEQQNQTRRLKSEIQSAIKSAENQYEAFLQSEKNKRKQRLANYANSLISNFDVKIEKDEEVIQKLECIATRAEIEMDIVLGKKDKSHLIDCGEITKIKADSEDESAGEEETTEEDGAAKEEEVEEPTDEEGNNKETQIDGEAETGK